MMECQLCGDQNGPWEFADVLDNDKPKVMLICENCHDELIKLAKKKKKPQKMEYQYYLGGI